jgi:hypothetical protein
VRWIELVEGNVYLETHVEKRKLITRHSDHAITAKDSVGYQFKQMRGIFILETPLGTVAVIPVGMDFVSSVIITAEEGVYLHKGQEFGYFQFGASDYIMLFPSYMNINFTAKVNSHCYQGNQLAYMS